MTCSQLEVTSDCVCTQPKREHLVQDFNNGKHRVRDTVTTARRPDCSYYASIAQTVADKKLSRVLVTDEAWLMPGAELMFPQHAD